MSMTAPLSTLIIRGRLRTASWAWAAIARARPGDPIASAAASVRVLEITRDHPGVSYWTANPESFPAEIEAVRRKNQDYAPPDADPEKSLISALGNMPNLCSFVWWRENAPSKADALWAAVRRCKYLRSLRVLDQTSHVGPPSDCNLTSMLTSSEFLQIGSLEQLEISTYQIYDSLDHKERIRGLESLIELNAASLKSLHIRFAMRDAAVDISNFLNTAHLPHLTCLSFVRARSTASSLSRFLNAHPTLTNLVLSPALGLESWRSFQLSPESLPHLQTLHAVPWQAAVILRAAPPTRPLWCLTGVDVHPTVSEDAHLHIDEDDLPPLKHGERAPWRAAFLAALAETGARRTMTHLGLNIHPGVDGLAELALAAPGVRWLDAGGTRDPQQPGIDAIAVALRRFDRIEALHGGIAFGIPHFEPSGEESVELEVEVAVVRMALGVPTLRIVEGWGWVLTIERREDGAVKVGKVRQEMEEWLLQAPSGIDMPGEALARAAVRRFGGPALPGPAASATVFEN